MNIDEKNPLQNIILANQIPQHFKRIIRYN